MDIKYLKPISKVLLSDQGRDDISPPAPCLDPHSYCGTAGKGRGLMRLRLS